MMGENFLFHVHTPTDVRKMTLTSRPESVNELKLLFKQKFQLDFDFSVSYEDPDFDGQLCSLGDIEELPQKAVLKVVPSVVAESSASGAVAQCTVAQGTVRTEKYSHDFVVPEFTYEVELILAEGNLAYEKTGKRLKLLKGQKHNVLQTIADKINSLTAYPDDKLLGSVAQALVNKHPCLRDPASPGWYAWLYSLKFKMGNYRYKLKQAGCLEVTVNAGKRSKNNPERQPPHSKIKKPRRAEVNFLPNYPRGEDGSTLEQLRQEIVEECKMQDKNMMQIQRLMQTTFALRRKEIISDVLPLADVLVRWPALMLESQISAEFHRITNINLESTFYEHLDQHLLRLHSLYRKKAARSGKVAEALGEILRVYDLQGSSDVNLRRAVALRGLPFYLHEDDATFIKTWDVSQSEFPEIEDLTVGLVLISANSADASLWLCPEKTSVVLEGDMIIEFPTIGQAFVMLFGSLYALDLTYPKQVSNTFEFIQKCLMGLDGESKMKPKVLTLRNELCEE
ncbi:uncharacterized protein LOC143127899 [Alosa pseudoharengus]|uniref:uncharacterized protein LOC143127899 n=1 Tax=Alosa pseudoharengus TaxID=34774 RepID=UPI003F8A01CB